MWNHSLDNQGCVCTLCSRVRWNTFKAECSSSSLRNTLLHLNWMPQFLKQLWSNKRNTYFVIWEKLLKSLKKCVLWFNHFVVFTAISRKHFAKKFINFGTKRIYQGRLYYFFITSSKIRDSQDQLWNLFLYMKTSPEATIYKKAGRRVVQILSNIMSATNNSKLFQNIKEPLPVETHLYKAPTWEESLSALSLFTRR